MGKAVKLAYLLELLDGTLVNTTALVDQVTSLLGKTLAGCFHNQVAPRHPTESRADGAWGIGYYSRW